MCLSIEHKLPMTAPCRSQNKTNAIMHYPEVNNIKLINKHTTHIHKHTHTFHTSTSHDLTSSHVVYLHWGRAIKEKTYMSCIIHTTPCLRYDCNISVIITIVLRNLQLHHHPILFTHIIYTTSTCFRHRSGGGCWPPSFFSLYFNFKYSTMYTGHLKCKLLTATGGTTGTPLSKGS